MIRTLRAAFLSRHLREKVLLVAFAILAAAWWFSSFTTKASHFIRYEKSTTLGLQDQAHWLGQKSAVEAQANSAASHLDANLTYDTSRLVGEVSRIANELNLGNKFQASSATTEGSGQFKVTTMNLGLQKVDWETVKSFYLQLQAKSPYIGIEQFSIARENGNPQILNASIKVSAVQVVSQ